MTTRIKRDTDKRTDVSIVLGDLWTGIVRTKRAELL